MGRSALPFPPVECQAYLVKAFCLPPKVNDLGSLSFLDGVSVLSNKNWQNLDEMDVDGMMDVHLFFSK